MEIEKPSRRRRKHTEEFKQAMIAACCETGASVAGIALANAVNANQVRRWMRERGIEPPRRSLPVRSISSKCFAEPTFVPIQSAKLNGHEPFAYLKNVLTRLPTQPPSRVGELLPHRWQPQILN